MLRIVLMECTRSKMQNLTQILFLSVSLLRAEYQCAERNVKRKLLQKMYSLLPPLKLGQGGRIYYNELGACLVCLFA